MSEQFSNLSQTGLSGPVAPSDPAINVLSSAAFPGSAQYRVRVDNEIMIVTGGAGSLSWSVTRGAEGTSAAAHAAGAAVIHILTAGALGGQSDPAAGTPGLRTLGQGAQQALPGAWLPWIDVQRFGVVADSNSTGTSGTDNTAAIQAALNSAAAAGGGLVQIQAGLYRVTGQITVPRFVVFRGCGRGVTSLIVDATVFPVNTPVVTIGTTGPFSDSNSEAFQTRVESMTIDCRHVAGSSGVYSNAAQEFSGVRDLYVRNSTFVGAWLAHAGSFTAQNCDMLGINIGISDVSSVSYASTTLSGAQNLSLLGGSGTLTVSAVPTGAASVGACIVQDAAQGYAFVVYYTGKTATTLTGCSCPDPLATTTADLSVVDFGSVGVWVQNLTPMGIVERVTIDVPNGVNTQCVGVRVDASNGILSSINVESVKVGVLLGVHCSGLVVHRVSGDPTITDLVQVTANASTGWLLEGLAKVGATNTVNDLRASVNQAVTQSPIAFYTSGTVGSQLTFSRVGTSDNTIQTKLWTDAAQRFAIWANGHMVWADGTNPGDLNLYRNGAGQLKTDYKMLSALGIGVGNSAAATTPGTVVKKMEVFDASGVSLGFVPIYNAIT